MNFELYAFRFRFTVERPICFPPGKASNILRGGLGLHLRQHDPVYQSHFDPHLASGPSGLRTPPRPFAFRAAQLNGASLQAGERFYVDVHFFDRRDPPVGAFRQALAQVAAEGIGPAGGRAKLTEAEPLGDADGLVSLPLEAGPEEVHRIRVRFLTPTELKSQGRTVHEAGFEPLFARVRDRISTLSRLYGGGPLELDFRSMGKRARLVTLVEANIHIEEIGRRSSRTGQEHPLGGIVGEVVYAGDLREFLPFLQAAYWTGVGRHTVWGNGVIQTTVLAS